MRAVEAVYFCQACGSRPVLPGADLSWYYGCLYGMTPANEYVFTDLDQWLTYLDPIKAWVQRGVESDGLPSDSSERGLHLRLLETAVDRSPLGLPYCFGSQVCPACGERALHGSDYYERPLLAEIPQATFCRWSAMSDPEREAALRAEADRALADPWLKRPR